MKTSPIVAFVAILASVTSLFGADSPSHGSASPANPSNPPQSLSSSDWSGIRGAYERGRHAIVVNPDGTHQARNPGQAWLTRFDGRGFTVTPDSREWSWGLELAGFGEVNSIRHDEGRIEYLRADGLTEWFVNDSRGLEQGWTLSKRPERAGASGPIRLDLSVRGSLRPEISAEGANVTFLNESGGAALNYSGLKAWDADGKPVQVRFSAGKVGSSGFCVTVDDIDATYPITVDPIAQHAYLKASNTGMDDYFGNSVAVSGDTVVVGASGEASNASGVNGNQLSNVATRAGAAYVFVRNGSTWTQQAYLKASNPDAGDEFGVSVAVSGDTVVVGAIREASNATGVNGNQLSNVATMAGAAYVFVRSGSTWSQEAYLKASNAEAYDFFGCSVAASGDTVVVGAYGEDASGAGGSNNSEVGSGAAYVFARNGSTWSQQGYLKASNAEADDYFGASVAVSGNTVVVGAHLEDSSSTGVDGNQGENSSPASGAAFVFVRMGTSWSQEAYLKASNTDANDTFGTSVAVAGDTVVVGANNEQSGATVVNGDQGDNSSQTRGAAYVFFRNAGTWSQQAYLKASEVVTEFGGSVAIAGDMAVVSATGSSTHDIGAAYVFERSGTTWSRLARLMASNSQIGNNFGCSVAVSGSTVVVGASGEDSNSTGVNGNQADNSAESSGAAYVFVGPYTLSASSAHGPLTGAGEYDAGTTASLAVTVNPGYLFTGWTGDATGTDNPLQVLMDSDKAITANFGPDINDNDGDGLTNYQEIVELGTNPGLKDTDGDQIEDAADAFPLDPAETLDTDGDGTGDNADPDDDGDGYTDHDEVNIHHTNPKLADSDGDGLTDPQEIQTHLTNPNLADTDNDGLRDGAEVNTHGTNPKVGDTDGDDFLDGYEVDTGKSPLNDQDKPALVAEVRTAIEVTFPSALGKAYRIEGSFNLSNWETVESGIQGTGTQIQRFYSTRGMPQRFFRVEEDVQ